MTENKPVFCTDGKILEGHQFKTSSFTVFFLQYQDTDLKKIS